MNKIYAGFQILTKYDPDFVTCAEHDIIFATTTAELSEEDMSKMNELGWMFDEQEGWSCYT